MKLLHVFFNLDALNQFYGLTLFRWQDTKEEFDEYQQNSQELESEMEIQLEQSERKTKELTSHNEKLQTELDSLRVNQ